MFLVKQKPSLIKHLNIKVLILKRNVQKQKNLRDLLMFFNVLSNLRVKICNFLQRRRLTHGQFYTYYRVAELNQNDSTAIYTSLDSDIIFAYIKVKRK